RSAATSDEMREPNRSPAPARGAKWISALIARSSRARDLFERAARQIRHVAIGVARGAAQLVAEEGRIGASRRVPPVESLERLLRLLCGHEIGRARPDPLAEARGDHDDVGAR